MILLKLNGLDSLPSAKTVFGTHSLERRGAPGLTAEGRNFLPGQIYILDTKTALEITGATVERGQHKLEANVLAPYAGVQTEGFTRWLRQTPGTHQTVAVSRLLQRREALFVRKDGPDVWLLQ